MQRSLPDDLFYDPDVAGIHLGEEREPQVPWYGGAEVVRAQRFYRRREDHEGGVGRVLGRIAARPFLLALVMLGVGFFTVFVQQATLLYQIVFGAPVFEEFLKFGLALLIAYPLRFIALRLPIAWTVGAGFGVLEHFVTYPDESLLLLVDRIVFHGGATGLSMASFHVLESSPAVLVRWVSTAFATFLHYVNNALAVMLLPLNVVFGGVPGMVVAITLALATLVATGLVLAYGARFRTRVEQWSLRYTMVQPEAAGGAGPTSSAMRRS